MAGLEVSHKGVEYNSIEYKFLELKGDFGDSNGIKEKISAHYEKHLNDCNRLVLDFSQSEDYINSEFIRIIPYLKKKVCKGNKPYFGLLIPHEKKGIYKILNQMGMGGVAPIIRDKEELKTHSTK